MNKEFIPYEQACELKELGFNEPCVAYYTADAKQLSLVQGYDSLMFADYVHLDNTVKSIPCPLYQQAFRWFREKHGLASQFAYYHVPKWTFEILEFTDIKMTPNKLVVEYSTPKTYEEAELACLKKLIELVKKK